MAAGEGKEHTGAPPIETSSRVFCISTQVDINNCDHSRLTARTVRYQL